MNQNLVKGIAILIFGITLVSCDCHQNVSGKVLDSQTKEPIDSVYVHKINKDYGKFTSENGAFELDATSGGLFGCPPMKIVLNKNGYEQKVEEIENSENKTIFLTKNQ
tara:strand:+ start:4580 stop:4903 length:324 start_codon:yes stop_codon:yes gene_type:complete